MKNKVSELKSYECSLNGEHWTTINALSSGKAKSEYIRGWDDIKYIYVKCRVLGYPYTSEAFVKNAIHRNIEFAYCGMAVEMDGNKGVIIGYNDSCNLNILFTDGKLKNQISNCHPHYKMTYYDKQGNILKEFN